MKTLQFNLMKKTLIPRTVGLYGMQSSPLVKGDTWIESEMFCSDHGKFERKGIVRHAKTGQLVRVRLDIADTWFSIPATTATEHGYVTGDTDTGELQFRPHTEQSVSPSQFRKDTRKAYR